MSFNNYQPSDWPGDDSWAKLNRTNQNRPNRNRPDQNNSSFINSEGRRCRIVCEPPRNNNLQSIMRFIVGKNINDARGIYPDIRVVVQDGQDLVTTMDYRPERINVETNNNIITRVVGLY